MSTASAKGSGARTRARELLLQALYQKQLSGHSPSELLGQFREQVAYERVDQEYFDEQLTAICKSQDSLEASIDTFVDRPLDQLDPVELGILLIGVHELQNRNDIPYKVVINESVNLARRFGALDGHKYVNACLDVAAKTLRKIEVQANVGG
ncbi:MAG: transcription antitermination factor NusB [Woeseiaceae bacterium]